MFRIDGERWLTAAAFLLVFAAGVCAATAQDTANTSAAPLPQNPVAQGAAQSPTQVSGQGQTPASGQDSGQKPAEAKPAAALVPISDEERGDTLAATKRYQAAIAAYKLVTPTATIYNKMGIAYQMMFNMDDALRCYKASLQLEPKNANVMNNLGTVYDSHKEFRDAEHIYRKALRIDPHSAIILKNLGTNLLAQHKFKQGWEVYQAAIKEDPLIFNDRDSPRVENSATPKDRGAVNYYMAMGCARAGFNDQAIEYLRLALNEGYTNPKKIAADNQFASLRDLPAFKQLIAEQSAR
jgi:Tfp pilus assembly protein PilF